ncbi:hypothetical protein DFJ73DRAFT_816410 [Zopfochytrium polystomum]|nr:hypothetical protein DFJ73DRAFT_816410 [Zopfochytrium polystomum]
MAEFGLQVCSSVGVLGALGALALFRLVAEAGEPIGSKLATSLVFLSAGVLAAVRA